MKSEIGRIFQLIFFPLVFKKKSVKGLAFGGIF